MPDGKSILSPLQLESNGCTVVDKARGLNGGEQPYFQSPDGHRIPLSMVHGLMCARVRPVLDSEWDSLPHAHLTADNEWDPRIFDHDVDKDWDANLQDPVEEHYKDLPYDRFGNAKAGQFEGDVEGEPTTRAEIEANLTSLIEDELVGSVIEYDIDGETFHRDPSSDDKDCDWGDWKHANHSQWFSYDVEGRRRGKRDRRTVNYDDT